MKKTLCFAVVLLLAGCAVVGGSDLSQILQNPDAYVGKRVTVTGVAENTGKIFSFSGYTLRDGNKTIPVRSNTLPAEDTQVTVSGAILPSGGVFGGSSVYLEANDKAPSNPTIRQIKNSPKEYIGAIVTVSGTVSNSVKIGEWMSFNLEYEGYKIGVKSSTVLPSDGSQATVTGAVGRTTQITDKDVYIQATSVN